MLVSKTRISFHQSSVWVFENIWDFEPLKTFFISSSYSFHSLIILWAASNLASLVSGLLHWNVNGKCNWKMYNYSWDDYQIL